LVGYTAAHHFKYDLDRGCEAQDKAIIRIWNDLGRVFDSKRSYQQGLYQPIPTAHPDADLDEDLHFQKVMDFTVEGDASQEGLIALGEEVIKWIREDVFDLLLRGLKNEIHPAMRDSAQRKMDAWKHRKSRDWYEQKMDFYADDISAAEQENWEPEEGGHKLPVTIDYGKYILQEWGVEDKGHGLESRDSNLNELKPAELMLLEDVLRGFELGHSFNSKEGKSFSQYWTGKAEYNRKMKALNRLLPKLEHPKTNS
jgi:hypothetical protein